MAKFDTDKITQVLIQIKQNVDVKIQNLCYNLTYYNISITLLYVY